MIYLVFAITNNKYQWTYRFLGFRSTIVSECYVLKKSYIEKGGGMS